MKYDYAESLAHLRTQAVLQIPPWLGHADKIKYMNIVIKNLNHFLSKLKERNDVA